LLSARSETIAYVWALWGKTVALQRYRRRLKAEGRLSWRAEARKSMVCIDCGGAIVGALRSDQKRCDQCRRAHKAGFARRWRQRKAGTPAGGEEPAARARGVVDVNAALRLWPDPAFGDGYFERGLGELREVVEGSP